MTKRKPITVKVFKAWLAELTEMDRINFEMLLSLPKDKVVALVAEMDEESTYRRMVIFALAAKAVLTEK